MSPPRVWLIILNWNGREQTLACLATLRASAYPAQALIVDNGSQDGSSAAIAAEFPEAQVLELDRNTGFSYAVNRGIERALGAGADYVLLLNNDTTVAPDMLGQLVTFAEAHPQYGLVSPLIYQADAPRRFWIVGGWWRVYSIANEGWGTADTGQYTEPTPFDLVFGTALLISARLIERVGMLDERFFVYFEDVDFCLRARRAGFRAVVLPQARVWHAGSLSTRDRPAMKEFYIARGRVLLFRKHLPVLHFVVFCMLQLPRELRALQKLLFAGKLPSALAYVAGLLIGIANRQQTTVDRWYNDVPS